MMKYCDEANLRFTDKWSLNKEALREHLEDKSYVGNNRYKCLVEITVRDILGDEWDTKNIFVIDDERARGTLVFLIPHKTCVQPSWDDYLMTFLTPSSSEYSDMDVCECLMTNMIRFPAGLLHGYS